MPSDRSRLAFLVPLLGLSIAAPTLAQPHAVTTPRPIVIVPDAVWDGVADAPHRGWIVVVRGQKIDAVGPEASTRPPEDAERWLRQAADGGHTGAMADLGVLLRNRGQAAEAARWWR